MPETQWMTLLETADLMKRLPTQVTRMCEDGKLEYYREDGRYFVSRESIDLFMHPRAGASTTRLTGVPEVGVDRESTALKTSEADVDYPDRAGTDVYVEDTSAGADSHTDSILGADGTSRRKYGRAPEDFGASSQTVPEPETVNGQEGAGAVAEEETGTSTEEPPAAHEDTVETVDSVDENENGEAFESANQLLRGDSHEVAEEAIDSLYAVEEIGTAEEPEAVATQETTGTPEAAEEPVAVKAPEAVEEKGEAPEAVEETNAVDQEQMDSEGTPAEPVDSAQQTEETPIYSDTGSEQSTQETDQEVSTMIPDESTHQVTEILADIREAIARHAEAHRAFCDEVSGLADALESTFSSGEDKTSELTREISSLLARYAKR